MNAIRDRAYGLTRAF